MGVHLRPASRARILAAVLSCALAGIFARDLPAQDAAQQTSQRPDKIRAWPIYYSEVWPDGSSERDAFFSLFHAKSLHGESSLRIVPLFWAGTSAREDSRWSLFVPFYYYKRDPLLTKLVTPVFRRTTTALGSDLSAGVPYVFDLYRQSAHDGAHDAAFAVPLPWNTPGRDPIALARHNRDAGGAVWHSHVIPLYYYSTRPGASEVQGLLVVPPLLYGRYWEGTYVRHLVLPLAGWMRFDCAERSANLFFGLWSAGQRGSVHRWLRLEPLYSHHLRANAGHFEIAHIYGREWDAEQGMSAHRVLYPLGFFERGPGEQYQRRFLPIYYASNHGGREVLALFPIYGSWRSTARSWQVVVPLYFREVNPNGGTLVALPGYFDLRRGDKRRHGFLPLYYAESTPRDSILSVLGPLYVREREEGGVPAAQDSVLWPLYQYSRHAGGWHFHAFPALWHTRSGADRLDVIVPVYVRIEDETRTHHWVLPLWGQYTKREQDGSLFERSVYALGSVIHSRRTNAAGARTSNAVHVLGPLAGFARDDVKETSHSRLLPIWYRERTRDRELTLLFPAYFQKEGPGQSLSLWGGNLWVDRTSGDRREVSALWPLVRYRAGGDNRKLDALLLFSWRDMGASRTLRITPLYYSRSATSIERAAPLLHFATAQRGGAERSRSLLFGFAGSHTSPTRNDWHAFPLFSKRRYSAENGALERWSLVLFPLFDAHSQGQGDHYTLRIGTGLFERRVSRESEYSKTALFFNLWRDERWPTCVRRQMFPLWRYDRWDNGARRFFVSFAYGSTVHAPGQKARGLLSPEGFYGLQCIRHTQGDASVTWALNPFLFGYHRNDASGRSDWRALLLAANGHSRPAESAFQVLGLVRGRSTPARGEWSLSPIVHSEVERERSLRSFDWSRVLHLYYRGEDAAERRWSLLWHLASGSGSKVNGDGEFRIMHRFVEWTRSGTSAVRAVHPFFTWEEDTGDGYFYNSVLSFVYRAERKGASQPLHRHLFGFIPLWSST